MDLIFTAFVAGWNIKAMPMCAGKIQTSLASLEYEMCLYNIIFDINFLIICILFDIQFLFDYRKG